MEDATPEFRAPVSGNFEEKKPLHERVQETQDLVGNPAEPQEESADAEPTTDNEPENQA